VRAQKKKKHKVILIGDSHARGCAEKLSNYLGNACEVTGYVSPNTGLDVITNSAKEEIDQLTQKDVVIVCGGTNYISKNESNKGLRYVTQFVQNKRSTNVIIMNAPNRFDLEDSSCVNKEVREFNRALNKRMNRYKHIEVINMSSKRDTTPSMVFI
jgi:lysophospholipase L1-like esterase